MLRFPFTPKTCDLRFAPETRAAYGPVLMSTALPDRPPSGPENWRILIVASEYNRIFVDGLVDAATQEFGLIAPASALTLIRVPGSFEIPLAVQAGLSRYRPDGVLALGVIFDGETLHASLIAGAVTQSLMQLSLDYQTPVFHEVLVVRDMEQAKMRCLNPELNRGTEAARAAVRMLRTLAQVSTTKR
jgi:6,7-dimethyl-8-ribityllumazine synthase